MMIAIVAFIAGVVVGTVICLIAKRPKQTEVAALAIESLPWIARSGRNDLQAVTVSGSARAGVRVKQRRWDALTR
jgi:xanthine/uracil permease